jgi:hypothetical protein
MPSKKNYKPLIAMAVLAVAALTMATLTFTNVTYWLINATLPPAMKYAGDDTAISGRSDNSGYNRYVYVTYYYDPNTGYNVTRISIVGFTGDPTNYTDVIKLCNKYYSRSISVELVAKGPVGTTRLESYVRDFRVYLSTDATKYVEFSGTSVVKGSDTLGTIGPGSCITLGAYVLVDPNLPADARNGKTVIAQYEIDVLFKPQ